MGAAGRDISGVSNCCREGYRLHACAWHCAAPRPWRARGCGRHAARAPSICRVWPLLLRNVMGTRSISVRRLALCLISFSCEQCVVGSAALMGEEDEK